MKKRAFTTIELALVLAIIGIVIAGVYIAKDSLFTTANFNKIRTYTKNSPLKDMEGLALWYDVSTAESFKNSEMVDGGAISEWKNISPINHHKLNVTQSTGANQPLYIIDSKDHYPLLRFDGSNDILTKTSVAGYEIAQPNQITLIVVQKYNGGGNNTFTWNDGVANKVRLKAIKTNGDIEFNLGNATGQVVDVAPSSFENRWSIISCVRRANDTGVIRVNGSDAASGAMTYVFDVTVVEDIEIGLNSNADIREIIVFKRELDSDEIDEVERYLSNKWSIELD